MKYFAVITAIALILTVWVSLRGTKATPPLPQQRTSSTEEAPAFMAAFLIYTNNIQRTFTAARYHEQSPEVYLTADHPQLIHVQAADITWEDFFATLPMRVANDCLTTGTGETYCTGAEGVLRFFLNGQEMPDVLARPIAPNDRLLITYGLMTKLDLTHQIQAVPYPQDLDTPTPDMEQ